MLIFGEWILWIFKVLVVEVEIYKVVVFDVVIFIVDTVRYEVLLYIWLVEYKFLVLCGFLGLGKIMILFSVFRFLFDMEVNIFLMFI